MTPTEPDYSFVRRPRWIASHLGVALLVVVALAAGLWQLDRHRDRAARNDVIEDRAALEAVPVGDVVQPDDDVAVGEREEYRRVLVTGEYRPDDEVLIRNRTLNGAPGFWVLTPLQTDDGWAVAVNRGWIARAYDLEGARPGTEPPSGTVTVRGWIQPSRRAETFQSSDPADGVLPSLARPDVERLGAQVGYPVLPVVLQLDGSQQPAGTEPVALDLPALDGGPHLSYTVQWFVFATIGLVGYPLVLRHLARGGGAPPDEWDELDDG